MGVDLVGSPVHDVHAAAIGLPSRNTGGKKLVCIGYTPIMLVLIFVVRRVGRGIAPLPESLDEFVALLVIREHFERLLLFVANDVADILIKPLLVGLA